MKDPTVITEEKDLIRIKGPLSQVLLAMMDLADDQLALLAKAEKDDPRDRRYNNVRKKIQILKFIEAVNIGRKKYNGSTKTAPLVSEDVRKQVLAIIGAKPFSTNLEIAAQICVPFMEVRDTISALKKEGILTRAPHRTGGLDMWTIHPQDSSIPV
jgi:hypothetical protein